MSKKKADLAAVPEDELKKFDYRSIDNRIYPKRGQLDDKEFTKIEDINLVHKVIQERSGEIASVVSDL